MSEQSPELRITLDEAVAEVLGLLTGLDLAYNPEYDRYRVIARMLNRALRANALEHEWSWYTGTESLGTVTLGQVTANIPVEMRLRQTGDDAVRIVDDTGAVRQWAYFLPRDALHKHGDRTNLFCSVVRDLLMFSHPFTDGYVGMDIQAPVMREPLMFRLPPAPEDPNDPLPDVDPDIRAQLIDYLYPDVITARAAYMYSLTDPVMQPRAQTLEANYKDLMYQAIERDDRYTDSPVMNEWFVPVQNGIYPESSYRPHPLADERR